MKWRLARFLRWAGAPALRALYRVRVVGLEHIPSSGGALLAGNHVSYLDPCLIWVLAPRRVHFMAKAQIFDMPVVGWLLPRLWAFPVRRNAADREALAAASAFLHDGELVGIFPEGTRVDSDGLGEAHGGVAFLAIRNGAPVVPIGVSGTDRIMPAGAKLPRFPRVTVRFGEPVTPADFAEGGRKERVEAMTAEIMRRIARELDRGRGA